MPRSGFGASGASGCAGRWARRSMVIVAVEVHDNPDEHRYEAVADGELAGFAAYRTQPGLIAFVHTEVKDAFEGHGIGSILIREALEDARGRGFEVLPFCPFVNSFIAEHREFVDLVPGSRREEFGL
jgi:predicted GNAT family acetyltransferase